MFWRNILSTFSVMKMETPSFFKMLVFTYESMWLHSPEKIIILCNLFMKIVLKLLLTYNFVCRSSTIFCKLLIHCLGWTLSNEPHFAALPSHLPVYLLHHLVLENRQEEFLTCLPELLPLLIYW